MSSRAASAGLIGWVLVVGAAWLEVVWPLLLSASNGGERLDYAAAGVSIAAIGLAIFTIALRYLPLGTAYSLWAGLGTAGVAVAGVVVFGDAMDLVRAGCLALIIGGVIGLALTDRPAQREGAP